MKIPRITLDPFPPSGELQISVITVRLSIPSRRGGGLNKGAAAAPRNLRDPKGIGGEKTKTRPRSHDSWRNTRTKIIIARKKEEEWRGEDGKGRGNNILVALASLARHCRCEITPLFAGERVWVNTFVSCHSWSDTPLPRNIIYYAIVEPINRYFFS